MDGIRKELVVISTQVLSEFYVTITRKVKERVRPEVALQQIQLLKFMEIINIDYDLIIKAIDILQKNKISYWDSLVIAAAVASGCKIPYSEDLNHGQLVGEVKILNPFL